MISKYWLLSVFLLLLIFIQNENNGAVSGAYRYYSYYYYSYYYYSYYYSYYYYYSYTAPIRVTARTSRAYSLSRLGPYYYYYYNLYFGEASRRTTGYTKYSTQNCLNLEANGTTFLGYFSCPLSNVDPSNHTGCCGDKLAQYCCNYTPPLFTGGDIAGIIIGSIILALIVSGLTFWIYQCYKAKTKVAPAPSSGTTSVAITTAHVNQAYYGPRTVTGSTFQMGHAQAPPPYPGVVGQPPPGYPPPGQPMYPPQGGNAQYPPPGGAPPPYASTNGMPSMAGVGGGNPAYPPQAPYPPQNAMPSVDVGGSGPPSAPAYTAPS